VPNSTIPERHINREDVALVLDDREEQEIVLWRGGGGTGRADPLTKDERVRDPIR
jgi:hypothetical protein